MARPREFDVQKAREDAMNVFWEGGFKETSLPVLLDGLKLSRGSLYKAFGSKRNIFLEALKLYDQTEWQPGVRLLKNRKISSGHERIEQVFLGAISRVENGDRRGCLLCNAAVGAAYDDEEISKMVQQMLAELTDGFDLALEDTDRFENSNRRDRRAKADEISMSYVGLRVLARSGSDVSHLKGAVTSMLQGLGI